MSPTFETGYDTSVRAVAPRVQVTVRVYLPSMKGEPSRYYQVQEERELSPEDLLDDRPLKRSAVTALKALRKALIASKVMTP